MPSTWKPKWRSERQNCRNRAREVVYCLARAGEFRDDCTGNHVARVGRYVGVIARQLGYREAPIELLELAAQLHDVGKIGIPDSILKKPGKLDSDEFAVMKRHCEMGTKIINPIDFSSLHQDLNVGTVLLRECKSALMTLAARIAATHHERWDGAGYPNGLAGEKIPIEGRMTAVADVFDALSSARPYKQPFPMKKCIEILEEGRGAHFDPKVLDAFFESWREIEWLSIQLADSKTLKVPGALRPRRSPKPAQRGSPQSQVWKAALIEETRNASNTAGEQPRRCRRNQSALFSSRELPQYLRLSPTP